MNLDMGSRIENLRKEAGLSQVELSKSLNIQRSTLSKIENNERKVNIKELIKLSDIFNISLDELVNPERSPKVIFTKDPPHSPTPNNEVRINIPQRHLEKFKQVFLYILYKVGSKPNVGETVIYKLLYFIDFNYYEKYEEQLIGAKYIKNHYGPTPVEFKKVTDQMIKNKEIEKIKSTHFSYPQTKYLPLKKPDLSLLNGQELEMINEVLNKLSDLNASEISDYSHKDVPWMTTENNQPIEYESVFYRTPEYSLRKYDKNSKNLNKSFVGVQKETPHFSKENPDVPV